MSQDPARPINLESISGVYTRILAENLILEPSGARL